MSITKVTETFRKRNVDLTKIPELNENGESNTLPTEAKDDNSDRKYFFKFPLEMYY